MVFLITESYVLDKTNMDRNLLSHNLKASMILAQKVNVTEILGDKLIDKIYDDINSSSLSGNYKTLVDNYLVDVVTYWTLYYALTNLLSQISNRGLQQQFSENSSQSDITVYRTLKSEFKNLAEYFSQRCNKWVYMNRGLFPEYEFCSSDGEQPANPNNKFFGGLVI